MNSSEYDTPPMFAADTETTGTCDCEKQEYYEVAFAQTVPRDS